MYYLAIETSCDETSIAILNDNKIIQNIIYSQIESHKVYKGIIPELASRLHYENIDKVLNEALIKSQIKLENISKIYYTEKPGLSGSLFIGIIFAKTLAMLLNIPAIGINHLMAHLFAPNIEHAYQYPLLGLLISGGHTATYLIKSPKNIELINETLDDAVGECFDKVGTLLKLDYPAGPKIDKLAMSGNQNSFKLPTPHFKNNLNNFSFSGIKTFMSQYIAKNNEQNINDICATFQTGIINILLNSLKLNYHMYNPKMIVITGGVSSNSELRKVAAKIFNTKYGKDICYFASHEYCTDNAAMIGHYGVILDKFIKEKNNVNNK